MVNFAIEVFLNFTVQWNTWHIVSNVLLLIPLMQTLLHSDSDTLNYSLHSPHSLLLQLHSTQLFPYSSVAINLTLIQLTIFSIFLHPKHYVYSPVPMNTKFHGLCTPLPAINNFHNSISNLTRINQPMRKIIITVKAMKIVTLFCWHAILSC